MRLFQNSGIYRAYVHRLRTLTGSSASFAEQINVFLDDRYAASHFLLPVLNRHPDAFFTNGDDEHLQRAWARENGLPLNVSLQEILLAQIENHRAEVFYNLDPVRYGSDFARRLPDCVRCSVVWWAAPSASADLSVYDLIVCNFPNILAAYRAKGWRTAYFSPAHDPAMDRYAANEERPIDVLFVGGYSRHHLRRAVVLENVAKLRDGHNVVFCLDRSRLTTLAESPLGRLLPLGKHRRSKDICAVSADPAFGRALYHMLSMAKIVLNCSVDMAGGDRGNMRCWESMGCGALMLSDEGVYPPSMKAGMHFETYRDSPEAVEKIERILADYDAWRLMARRAVAMMETAYSKELQWAAFVKLVEQV